MVPAGKLEDMELVLLLLVVAVVIYGALRLGARNRAVEREQKQELETQLATSKKAAEEDVTKFGEELRHLDSDVAGHYLDDAMRLSGRVQKHRREITVVLALDQRPAGLGPFDLAPEAIGTRLHFDNPAARR